MGQAEIFYRLEDHYTEGCDVEVWLFKYKVVSKTPCGVWITLGKGKDKFINLNATKKWACPTIEEAKKSYLRRKLRQIQILSAQLHSAKVGKELVSNDIIKETDWVMQPWPVLRNS
jgi:hypothetical protein